MKLDFAEWVIITALFLLALFVGILAYGVYEHENTKKLRLCVLAASQSVVLEECKGVVE